MATPLRKLHKRRDRRAGPLGRMFLMGFSGMSYKEILRIDWDWIYELLS